MKGQITVEMMIGLLIVMPFVGSSLLFEITNSSPLVERHYQVMLPSGLVGNFWSHISCKMQATRPLANPRSRFPPDPDNLGAWGVMPLLMSTSLIRFQFPSLPHLCSLTLSHLSLQVANIFSFPGTRPCFIGFIIPVLY